MRPQLGLCRGTQHHRWNFYEAFVIFGELEAGIFESLAEIVELGKVDVTSTARSSIQAGERGNSIAIAAQDHYHEQANTTSNAMADRHLIASMLKFSA